MLCVCVCRRLDTKRFTHSLWSHCECAWARATCMQNCLTISMPRNENSPVWVCVWASISRFIESALAHWPPTIRCQHINMLVRVHHNDQFYEILHTLLICFTSVVLSLSLSLCSFNVRSHCCCLLVCCELQNKIRWFFSSANRICCICLNKFTLNEELK